MTKWAMGKGQDLLDAARKGDERCVEKIIGQITKRSGPFTRWVLFVFLIFSLEINKFTKLFV